jgi:hypothetical protein
LEVFYILTGSKHQCLSGTPLGLLEINMQARMFIMQDETLRKAFGMRLKGLRKQKNWAQKKLAALTPMDATA